MLTQKWVHDLKAFNALAVPDQEKVFGRTKADAVEFSPEEMPDDSHVGRTDVDRDGVPQKMRRRSVPLATPLNTASTSWPLPASLIVTITCCVACTVLRTIPCVTACWTSAGR